VIGGRRSAARGSPVAEAGLFASKSPIIGVCKPLPPGPAHHRIEEITAAASRLGEPLADRAVHSGAVATHELGRKPKLTPHQQWEAISPPRPSETLSDIARRYNVHPTTISRLTA
jgi:hypothetical protein